MKDNLEETSRLATLVKDLVASHSYKETIGKWLEEMRVAAIQTLIGLDMGDSKIWQCQAELRVINTLYLKIQAQIDNAEKIRQKKLKKEQNNDTRLN